MKGNELCESKNTGIIVNEGCIEARILSEGNKEEEGDVYWMSIT